MRTLAKRVSNFILIGVPVFHLLVNFWWDPYREPLERNLEINHVLMWVIIIGYILFLFALPFSNIKIVYRVILVALAILFFCRVSSSTIFSKESHLRSVEFGSYRYHLTTDHYPGDSWDIYKLYQCHIFGGYCIPIELVIAEGNANHDVMDLVVDENLEEIHVYKFEELIFKYDPYHNW